MNTVSVYINLETDEQATFTETENGVCVSCEGFSGSIPEYLEWAGGNDAHINPEKTALVGILKLIGSKS